MVQYESDTDDEQILHIHRLSGTGAQSSLTEPVASTQDMVEQDHGLSTNTTMYLNEGYTDSERVASLVAISFRAESSRVELSNARSASHETATKNQSRPWDQIGSSFIGQHIPEDPLANGMFRDPTPRWPLRT
jgi:hypothetical protein